MEDDLRAIARRIAKSIREGSLELVGKASGDLDQELAAVMAKMDRHALLAATRQPRMGQVYGDVNFRIHVARRRWHDRQFGQKDVEFILRETRRPRWMQEAIAIAAHRDHPEPRDFLSAYRFEGEAYRGSQIINQEEK